MLLYDVSTSTYVRIGARSKNTRGAAESRLNCCRVSGETARFAGRGSETLGRVRGHSGGHMDFRPPQKPNWASCCKPVNESILVVSEAENVVSTSKGYFPPNSSLKTPNRNIQCSYEIDQVGVINAKR